MHITLSPVRGDTPLSLSRAGDALTVNGVEFDFAPLAEGDVLPRDAVACEWLASDVTRIDGGIHLTLILPHGADAPEETRFPEALTPIGDGPVPLPPHDAEPHEEPEA